MKDEKIKEFFNIFIKVFFILGFALITLFALIFFTQNSYGYQIIPENNYENRTIIFCQSICDSYNATIKCVDYHNYLIDKFKEKDNNTILINNTLVINNTIERTEIINITKYVLINNTFYVNDSTATRQMEMDHEFRMEQLKYNVQNSTSSEEDATKSYSESELQLKISEALSSREPPPSLDASDSEPKEPVDIHYTTILFVLGAIILGTFLFRKFKDKIFPKNETQKPYNNVPNQFGNQKRDLPTPEVKKISNL